MSLDFHTITIDDYDVLFPYIDKYGEHSCTWSFPHMFKYSDSFCIRENCVYLMRDHLNTKNHRVYMMPLCHRGYMKIALDVIRSDAAEHGCSFEFNNVTDANVEVLKMNFTDEFEIIKDRDWAEYIYSSATLSAFPGRRFSGIRNSIKQFNSKYGKDCVITRFGALAEDDALQNAASTGDVLRDVLDFQAIWLEDRRDEEDYEDLAAESLRITNMLNNYKGLRISGIAIYYKDEVIGYNFGAPNTSKCFDIIAEKGNIRFRGVYQKLVSEIAAFVSGYYPLINREEDVGIEGLRASKLHYGPEYLLEKSFAKHRTSSKKTLTM